MRERRARVYREPFAARFDIGERSDAVLRTAMAVRAQSIRGRMALEGLYVPAGAAFLSDFRAELLAFPAGRHDDQVDALGLVGQLLDTMVRPAPSKPVVRQRRDWWDRKERVEAVSWKVV